MTPLRSRAVTHGRNMAGARALLRAYAAMATSADTGAVRDVGVVERAAAIIAKQGAAEPLAQL
jgi:hypothetical protein